MRLVGPNIEGWHRSGSTGVWTRVVAHTDTSPMIHPGQIGIGMNDAAQAWRIDDFGGGSSSEQGYHRLVGPMQLSSSPTTLYVAPAGTTVRLRHIYANNPSGSPVDFTFSVGSDAAATRLYDSYNVPAADHLSWRYDHVLQAGETIQAYAGTTNTLVLVVDGYVETA
jgi:hypothetical protein